MFPRSRCAPVVVLLLFLTPPARGGLIVHRTRENGANAVRFRGRTYTLDRWIERRGDNPRRFDAARPQLGHALAMGKLALIERRARNPVRFDHYHHCLGWLLADAFPDEAFPSATPPIPIAPPRGQDLLPPGSPPAVSAEEIGPGSTPPVGPSGGGMSTPPGPGPGAAVPEPSGLALLASAAAGWCLFGLARRLRPRPAGPAKG